MSAVRTTNRCVNISFIAIIDCVAWFAEELKNLAYKIKTISTNVPIADFMRNDVTSGCSIRRDALANAFTYSRRNEQHGYGGKKEKIYLSKDIEHNYT